MLTAEGCCSPGTVAGLEDDTLADGGGAIERPTPWLPSGSLARRR